MASWILIKLNPVNSGTANPAPLSAEAIYVNAATFI